MNTAETVALIAVLGAEALAVMGLAAAAKGWIAFSLSLRVIPRAKRDPQIKAVRVIIPPDAVEAAEPAGTIPFGRPA